MIDKWFNQEVSSMLAEHQRIVITDKRGEGNFMLNYLPSELTILSAVDPLEELQARYRAEKDFSDKPVVFHTTMGKDGMKYLLEYAETGGLIDLDNLETYIRNKIWDHLGKNVNLSRQELMLAAKVCRGKDEKWWIKVVDGLESPFDLNACLIDFLSSPDDAKRDMDKDIWNVFQFKVYELLNMTPTEQPASTLASEVMNAIFDGLIDGDVNGTLINVYDQMTDSQNLRPVFENYLSRYVIPKDKSPFEVHPDHPFRFYDEEVTRMLSKSLENHKAIDTFENYINNRLQRKVAVTYKSSWLKDLRTILTFSTKGLNEVDTLEKFACYYRDSFTEMDLAMRKVYVAWLNERKTLQPIQYLYDQYEKELLDKWFSFSGQYVSNQHDYLIKALSAQGRIAVIVGDGLRLSIAKAVADNYPDKSLIIKTNTLFSSLPSVTDNGMSALYGCEGVTANAQERTDCLRKAIPEVAVINSDDLNDSVTAEKLVLKFGDIDQIGEKKQLSGLKDIDHYEVLLIEKIRQLLRMGYDKVILTTDHGFVLTGLLDDADKVPVPDQPIMKVEERYILSETQSTDKLLVERKSDYNGSHYQYYAKTDHPFRTTGSYGYSHGGFTPQECVIPAYDFSPVNGTESLKIIIVNKKELSDVAGSSFNVRIKAENDLSSSVFKSERKVKVLIFAGTKQVACTAILKLEAGHVIDDIEFDLEGDGKVVVIDADSKAQLDSAAIKKSSARDFGELL